MSAAPSEADSTHPTTPSSTAPPSIATTTIQKSAHSVPLTPPAVPVITVKARVHGPPPAVPDLKITPKKGEKEEKEGKEEGIASLDGASQSSQPKKDEEKQEDKSDEKLEEKSEEKAVEKPVEKPKINSWADLLKKNQSKAAADGSSGLKSVNGSFGSLEEALRSFQITHGDTITVPFLEPRGLINTGNMCFMNAVSDHRNTWCHQNTNFNGSRFCKCCCFVGLFFTSWSVFLPARGVSRITPR